MSTTTTPTTDMLVQHLSHLVRMPTLPHDHATNRAALDWVENQLKDLPLHIKRVEHNGFPSFIATTKRTKQPKLWLLAHIDVAPAGPDLFNPVIKNGRLTARGAFDMKYAIACFITLFRELGPDLAKYDLGLMITSDEEIGGQNGAQWLVAQGYRSQAVLNLECGASWQMEAGAKGVLHWRFTTTGRTAHGSRPWEGDNALDRLTRFVHALQQNAPVEPCNDNLHLHNTISLGRLNGGLIINQVPDSAQADVDIRIVPGTTVDNVREWIEAARLAIPGIGEDLMVESQPYLVGDHEAVTLFHDLAEKAAGHKLDSVLAHGGSDGRFFAAHGIPVITMPPQGGDQHGPNEWIDIADLDHYYNLIRNFITTWTKRG